MAYPHQEIPGVPPGIQLPRCLFFSSPSLTAEIEDEPCKEKYVHFFVTPLNTNWNEYFLLLFFYLYVFQYIWDTEMKSEGLKLSLRSLAKSPRTDGKRYGVRLTRLLSIHSQHYTLT